jgi:hypothetical protein
MRDPFGLHARNFQLADLHLAGPRDTCSMNGLWAEYAALFKLEVLEALRKLILTEGMVKGRGKAETT